MKVLYATDLHGQIPKFECVKRILNYHDILILGADLLPKGQNASEKRIIKFINEYLPSFFEYMPNIPIILDFGNDDRKMYYEMFGEVIAKYKNVYASHHNVIEFGSYTFAGMHYVPDYPFSIKDWCRRDGAKICDPSQLGIPFTTINGVEEKIGDLKQFLLDAPSIMEELNYLPKPTNKTIYLIHSPPSKSRLDNCWKRTYDKDEKGHLYPSLKQTSVGSIDVRKWIQKEKPWLCLHGHIHESFQLTGVCINKVFKTICINPGQKGGGGKQMPMFVWCEFDLNDVEKTFIRKEMAE